MKPRRPLILTIAVSAIVCLISSAYAGVNLSVVADNLDATDGIDIPISADSPVGIAGAAFTITYDTGALSVTVSSDFFGTFAEQFTGITCPDPPYTGGQCPTSVTIDSQSYDQPLVHNNVSVGTRIAAARATPADASNAELFNLFVQCNVGADTGPHTIGLEQTLINNVDAGYPPEGENIPYLVGSLPDEPDLTKAFPVIAVDSISIGTVTCGGCDDTDTPPDGLCDSWEMQHFGNLTTTDGSGDYDKDGYTDKVEHDNGSPFDPTVPDDPGGTGHNQATDSRIAPCEAVSGTQYNMVVYGDAYDEGSQATEGDWIIAYGPGGETDCRGLSQVNASGAYYLTVVGNTNGETVKYKLRRNNIGANAEFELLDACEAETTFASDATEADKALEFSLTCGCIQDLDFVNGWTWVSFNCMPDDTSLDAIFGANAADVYQVKTQTQSATNISGMGWMGDTDLMSAIETGAMFKVKATSEFALEATGTPIAVDTQISLFDGWTWIAYLPDQCMATETALDSVMTDLYQIKSQTQSQTMIAGTLMGGLTQMCPGEGYTINTNNAATLNYPAP